MQEVWIVFGDAGEFAEEFSRWAVAAWPSEEMAKAHAALATEAAKQVDAGLQDRRAWTSYEKAGVNPYDPAGLRETWTIGKPPTYFAEAVPWLPISDDVIGAALTSVDRRAAS